MVRWISFPEKAAMHETSVMLCFSSVNETLTHTSLLYFLYPSFYTSLILLVVDTIWSVINTCLQIHSGRGILFLPQISHCISTVKSRIDNFNSRTCMQSQSDVTGWTIWSQWSVRCGPLWYLTQLWACHTGDNRTTMIDLIACTHPHSPSVHP